MILYSLAKITPALWRRRYVSSGLLACVAFLIVFTVVAAAAPKPAKKKASVIVASDLASLVHAYREKAAPAGRTGLERYAAAHKKDKTGPLARLALGIAEYEDRDYAAAIPALAAATVPQLADYAAYYLAAARLESNDNAVPAGSLSPTHVGDVMSPFSAKAYVLEARALKGSGKFTEAVQLLRDRYAALPQPDGDITLADCYQAANDLRNAAEFYQRVYSQYVSGDAANRAAAALLALKDAMGAAYPEPLPQQLLQRADRFMDTRDYSQARAEYQAAADRLAMPERDIARVRMGAAAFLRGDTPASYPYLRSLDGLAPEADAERLYYLGECARRLGDDDEMMAAVRNLAERYPKSPWRLKALISAANRFLLVNRPDAYVPLYKAAAQDFPGEPGAGTAHWKVTFYAWLHGQPDAAELLREHLRAYPAHPTAGAALYFLGRSAEQDGNYGAARAYYERLSKAFQNTYYAMQARGRLARNEVGMAAISDDASGFAASLALPAPQAVPSESARATALRIERSQLLRTAGLDDLADSELRFGARTDGQPALLAMELARAAGATHQAMRIMKSLTPDYLSLPLDAAPRRFWELLFPLPYRNDLLQSARAKGLDPYLVAGLIRQESEFNPQALSHANAYGLTQVRPATGRRYARQAGVPRFTNRVLFQPAANLKIGSTVLRSMLDDQGGKLEPTLASYNAGPNRVSEWLTWNSYREPAEFVESIPFTETRDYVQAVLRNADIYRRLYGR